MPSNQAVERETLPKKRGPKSQHLLYNISACVPTETYDKMCTIAREKRVSLSQVVRAAIHHFLTH